MGSRLLRTCVLVAGVAIHAGCAHPASHGLDKFLIHRDAKQPPAARPEPPSPSLEENMGKIRKLMAEARPEPKTAPSQTLENRDPALREALAEFAATPTADNAVAVGAVYHRYGLLDEAYSYYSRALQVDTKSGAAYEGLARVWRDWRLPHLGLGDAVRATYYEPTSAAAENTLGTILQSIGRRKQARTAYTAALRLEPSAAYVLNNLCYLSFLDGDAAAAVDQCRRAITLDPTLAAAHNNLGLIYAASGRNDLATDEFRRAGGTAVAAYNMGVVYLARRQYTAAADEFERVPPGDPAFADAAKRARNARRLAGATADPGGHE